MEDQNLTRTVIRIQSSFFCLHLIMGGYLGQLNCSIVSCYSISISIKAMFDCLTLWLGSHWGLRPNKDVTLHQLQGPVARVVVTPQNAIISLDLDRPRTWLSLLSKPTTSILQGPTSKIRVVVAKIILRLVFAHTCVYIYSFCFLFSFFIFQFIYSPISIGVEPKKLEAFKGSIYVKIRLITKGPRWASPDVSLT